MENVVSAKRLLNTRLSRKEVEESDPENMRLVARFDAAVWKAIQGGTEYNG